MIDKDIKIGVVLALIVLPILIVITAPLAMLGFIYQIIKFIYKETIYKVWQWKKKRKKV